MTTAARRMSEQNLHERLALQGPDDELKELGDTFDAMLARLEAAFASQRRFVADASHELRTPLSIIRAQIDVALADPDASSADLRATAETVRTRPSAQSSSSTPCWCWPAATGGGPATDRWPWTRWRGRSWPRVRTRRRRPGCRSAATCHPRP